jgi:predicted alpha/beta-hydrolase family hydrolase
VHKELRVEVVPDEEVTALVYPAANRHQIDVPVILGHGAGYDQSSDFMTRFATGLASRGVNVVTFNFLYTEKGRGVLDANNDLEACFRIGRGKLIIGGKSMGGRIASQIAAAGSKADGLVFLGYPLHPPGKIDQLRAKHLPEIKVPMLFVQGSRDPFGTPDELRPIIKELKAPAELSFVAGGDHSFKVLKRADVAQEETYTAVLDRIEVWLRQTFTN